MAALVGQSFVAIANPGDVLHVVLIVEHCDDSLDHVIQARAESSARDDRGFGRVWIVKNGLARACFLEAWECCAGFDLVQDVGNLAGECNAIIV